MAGWRFHMFCMSCQPSSTCNFHHDISFTEIYCYYTSKNVHDIEISLWSCANKDSNDRPLNYEATVLPYGPPPLFSINIYLIIDTKIKQTRQRISPCLLQIFVLSFNGFLP